MSTAWSYIYGTDGDDTLKGTSKNDTIIGGSGNDHIYTGGGYNNIRGDYGDDYLYADEYGRATMWGGQGADTFVFLPKGSSSHAGDRDEVQDFHASQGDKLDVSNLSGFYDISDLKITYRYAGHYMVEDHPESGAEDFAILLATDKPLTNDDFIFSIQPQTLTGDGLDNELKGAGGADSLFGKQGDDHLLGEGQGDKLYGDEGNDTIEGGNGEDLLSGGNGNDRLMAGNDNDTLVGGWGNDSLLGENGNDILYAGHDYDSLNGDLGNDRLYADAYGRTIMWGGQGADTFIFGKRGTSSHAGNKDEIKDFHASQGDKINLSLLQDINTISDLTIAYDEDAGHYIIQNNPESVAEDLYITVNSKTSLTSSDFIF